MIANFKATKVVGFADAMTAVSSAYCKAIIESFIFLVIWLLMDLLILVIICWKTSTAKLKSNGDNESP